MAVEDNGSGFEEKYLDRIFAPSQRLHGRGEYEGAGMGLALCLYWFEIVKLPNALQDRDNERGTVGSPVDR